MVTFIVVLILLVWAVIQGRRRGFRVTLYGMRSWINLTLIALVLHFLVAFILPYTPFYADLLDHTQVKTADATAELDASSFSEWYGSISSSLPDFIAESLESKIISQAGDADLSAAVATGSELVETYIDVRVNYVNHGAAWFISFVLADIILLILCYIWKKRDKLPQIVKEGDAKALEAEAEEAEVAEVEAAEAEAETSEESEEEPAEKPASKKKDMLLGLAEGIIWVWVFFAAVAYLSTSPLGVYITTDISHFMILRLLYNINPVTFILALI